MIENEFRIDGVDYYIRYSALADYAREPDGQILTEIEDLRVWRVDPPDVQGEPDVRTELTPIDERLHDSILQEIWWQDENDFDE